VQIASAKTFLAAFGGNILGPAEGVDRCAVSGWGGGRLRSQLSSLSFRCTTEVDDQSFEIEMRSGPALPTWVALNSLLLQSLHPEIPHRIHFPLELRIHESRVSIRVEGRARRFRVLTCEDTATALAEVDGIAVRITGPPAVFNGLALRRLSEAELATLIREHRSRLSAARTAVPKS
jgi:hypothetical protein